MLVLLRNASALVVSLFITACAAGEDPSDVAEAFFQALREGDGERAASLATDETAASVREALESTRLRLTDLEIGAADQRDSTASVPVAFRIGAVDFKLTAHLQQTEAGWRVDAQRSLPVLESSSVSDAIEKAAPAPEEEKDD